MEFPSELKITVGEEFIAEAERRRGGRGMAVTNCPIALAGQALFPGLSVLVSGSKMFIDNDKHFEQASYELPQEARAFQLAFDRQLAGKVLPFSFTATKRV